MSIIGTYEVYPDFSELFKIKQFRRHNRSRIQAQKERTYYFEGKAVAKNRHKRTGQANSKNPFPSLSEYLQEHPECKGKLTVRKSTRSYNNMERNLPGTIYTDHGKQFVLRAQSNGIQLYSLDNVYHNIKNCKLKKHNSGLVSSAHGFSI